MVERLAELVASSGDDHIRPSLLQEVISIGQGHLRRGLLVGERDVGALDSVFDRTVAGDGVGHGGLKEQGGGTRGSLS